MHKLHQRRHMLHRRLRQNAVPQVEDMSGATAGPLQHICGPAFDLGEGGEQRYRVQVALDGDVVAQPAPGIVQVDAPIDADYIAAGLLHQLQHPVGVGPKVDDWHTGAPRSLDHLPRVGQHVFLVVAGAERADPRIE